MRLLSSFAGGLACLALLCPAARAESPPTPARLIPAEADLLVEVPKPRQAIEALLTLDALKQIQSLPQLKEFYNSTNYRRFLQLVAYFERELGAKWPELLDRIAGGGVALGVKFGPNPAPLLLAVQGRDQALMAKAFDLALTIIEGELARQEVKAEVKRLSLPEKGMTGVQIGDNFFMVRVEEVILVSNSEAAIRKGIGLHQGPVGKSLADSAVVKEGFALLPKDCLARLWLNFETVRKAPGAEALYKTPRDPGLATLFGSYLDVLGRSPSLVVGLQRDKQEVLLTARVPAGREGIGPEGPLHMPPEGQPGSRPLLEPKGVVYSSSFYLDFARIWTDRKALYGEQIAKAFEEADKNSGRIPVPGLKISKLLTSAGAYHRIVVVNQPQVPYKIKPKVPIPAFAFVTEMHDADSFSQSMEAVLRGVALFAGNQAQLKLVEEKHNDCQIVGYRFPEDVPLKADVNDLRFNFSPCFVRVGNQFVICSTLELCHELVDLLQAEAKGQDRGSPLTARDRIYAAGVADILAGFEELLVTQAVLDQAIPVEEARAQVKAFLALVRAGGSLNIETSFLPKEFRFEIRMK
jgi:hypothetical protein